MTTQTTEVNFDGLVGPTHSYAGLSFGNVASTSHRAQVSNPKEAALQGLKKMKHLADLGLKQAVLPPHDRPHLETLRKLGFTGKDAVILKKAMTQAPELFVACCSASSMWTANAATIAPSADTEDGRVHLTPANLINKFHRSIEAETTSRILGKIFKDPKLFAHHDPLPANDSFGDEGAANHTRLCDDYGKPGVQLFVYGRAALASNQKHIDRAPKRFPGRQTYEASLAIARLHQLDPDQVVFAQQNPDVVDAGVFHNDVISVGNRNVFFYHELAFVKQVAVLSELRKKYQRTVKKDLQLVEVKSNQVSLTDTVQSYLFNSQLITLPSGTTALIAPTECRNTPSVKRFLDSQVSDSKSAIREVHYLDLRQSMQNGGGPACLRLRIALNQKELAHTHSKIFLNDALYTQLTAWVSKHYRDRLAMADLADPKLLTETQRALDELTQVLKLGSVYSFQLS